MKIEKALQTEKFKNEMHKALLNIMYSAWWIKSTLSKDLKAYGLTHEQYNVLRILKGKYPQQICVREIACRMIERSSNVPRIIDRLEIKKLVKRNTSLHDKRETVITLTQAGINMLQQCTQRMDKTTGDVFPLTDTDARELNKLLEKVREKEL